MKWETKRVAITGGIIWAAALFITTLVSVFTGGYGKAFLDSIASIYPGYSISVVGSIIALIYGFLDVFVGVYIFMWVYQKLGK